MIREWLARVARRETSLTERGRCCLYLRRSLLVLLAIVSVSCREGAVSVKSDHLSISSDDEDTRNPRMNLIMGDLEDMPNWMVGPPPSKSLEVREQIEFDVEQIADEETADIREAVAKYSEIHSHYGLLSTAKQKMFLLNKYLFNLPERVRLDSPHLQFLGAGWGPVPFFGNREKPQPSDGYDYRWPWSAGEDGVWRLTGVPEYYMGPDYDAVAAFDYYLKVFGRRPIKK